MNKKIYALTFLLTFFLLVNSVHAQEFWSPEYLWTEILGLPQEWTQPREFLFKFMIPFIALYAILLGLLKSLRIFPTTSYINWVLAFAMAFMTLPSRIFVTIVGITLGFAGMFGYIIFLAMFFGGSYLYAKGFLHKHAGIAATYKAYKESIRHMEKDEEILSKRLADLYHQLSTIDPADPHAHEKMGKIERQIREVKSQLENVREKIRLARYHHS